MLGELTRNRSRYLGEVQRLRPYLGPAGAGQDQQIIYELAESLGGSPHSFEPVAAALIQLLAVVAQQGLAETVDGAQRCAQVMGD